MVKEWLENTKDCKIPSNLVPKCPVCGENMEMNLRKDANFVQDDNWYKQSNQYETREFDTSHKELLHYQLG